MIGAGVRIRTSDRMVKLVAYPRSPARARRRAKLGYRQHMAWRPDPKVYCVDGVMYCHPLMLARVKAMVERANRRLAEELPPEKYSSISWPDGASADASVAWVRRNDLAVKPGPP